MSGALPSFAFAMIGPALHALREPLRRESVERIAAHVETMARAHLTPAEQQRLALVLEDVSVRLTTPPVTTR